MGPDPKPRQGFREKFLEDNQEFASQILEATASVWTDRDG